MLNRIFNFLIFPIFLGVKRKIKKNKKDKRTQQQHKNIILKPGFRKHIKHLRTKKHSLIKHDFCVFVVKKENSFWKHQPNKPLMTHFSFLFLLICVSCFLFLFLKKIKIKFKNMFRYYSQFSFLKN